MKSKLLLPAFVLVLAACSGNPPPPSETPLGPDEPAPSGEGPVAPASNEMVKQGRDFIQAEKFEDAKKVLSDARAKDPKDPQAAYYLGVSLQSLGDAKGAEKEYKAALELDGKLTEASVNLSGLLLETNDAAGALTVVEAALMTAPKQPDLLLNRAVALEATGKKAEALTAYGAAVQARSDDPMLRAAYGGLLSEAGKGKEAVVELKAAMVTDDPALLVSIASIFTKENAFDECIQAAEKALAKKKVPAVLVRRGICKDGKKDEKGAVADYEAALAMDPNFAPAHYYFGLNLAAKDKKKALEHLDKAAVGAGDKGIGPDAKKKAAELRGGKK
jgi:Tfp pilus assembly protein PilF